jgi:hypothetical protein
MARLGSEKYKVIEDIRNNPFKVWLQADAMTSPQMESEKSNRRYTMLAHQIEKGYSIILIDASWDKTVRAGGESFGTITGDS